MPGPAPSHDQGGKVGAQQRTGRPRAGLVCVERRLPAVLGHVRGRRPAAPFLPRRAPQPPPRRRAPRPSARPPPAESNVPTVGSCAASRPAARALSSPAAAASCGGRPARRFGGLVRRGASLAAVNTALSAARGLASPPPATAATSPAAASSAGDRPPPLPRAAAGGPPRPHYLPAPRDLLRSDVPATICATSAREGRPRESRGLASGGARPPIPLSPPLQPRPRAQGRPARRFGGLVRGGDVPRMYVCTAYPNTAKTTQHH